MIFSGIADIYRHALDLAKCEQRLKHLATTRKKHVWQVMICDYEACWAIGTYDSEQKAEDALKSYELVKNNHEQSKGINKLEVL